MSTTQEEKILRATEIIKQNLGDNEFKFIAQADEDKEEILKRILFLYVQWFSDKATEVENFYALKMMLEQVYSISIDDNNISKVYQIIIDMQSGLKDNTSQRPIIKQDISQKPGTAFEQVVLELVQKMGFEAETTKASGDGGIDIIAYSNRPMMKGKYIIQCKDWTSTVGEPPIRDLYGVVHSERANKGILITTSTFTISAIKFAQDKPLELIDGTEYYKLLSEYGISNTIFDNDNKPNNDNLINHYYSNGYIKVEYFSKIKDGQSKNTFQRNNDYLNNHYFGIIKCTSKSISFICDNDNDKSFSFSNIRFKGLKIEDNFFDDNSKQLDLKELLVRFDYNNEAFIVNVIGTNKVIIELESAIKKDELDRQKALIEGMFIINGMGYNKEIIKIYSNLDSHYGNFKVNQNSFSFNCIDDKNLSISKSGIKLIDVDATYEYITQFFFNVIKDEVFENNLAEINLVYRDRNTYGGWVSVLGTKESIRRLEYQAKMYVY